MNSIPFPWVGLWQGGPSSYFQPSFKEKHILGMCFLQILGKRWVGPSVGALGTWGAAAGLGCALPCLSPAFLPSNWDFVCLHKMSCVFTGQHFSSFPNLQMSFEAPLAGFLAARDVLVALDLFWGWRSIKHPLNRCQPIPILPSLMSLALLCVPALRSVVPHTGKKQRSPKENTFFF